MAAENTVELASLRFDRKRFENHALDVECTQELIAYRTLVLECAKELWRRKNPNRVRLPRGFEDGFRLEFDRVDSGSAVLPLRRVRDLVQGELDHGDDFDDAAQLIDAAIAAADRDDLLPERLPANVIPLFRDFGRSLRPDEILFTRARQSNEEAAYTPKARARLAAWLLNTDYDGRTFCIFQAFFPDKSKWSKLAKALGDVDVIEEDAFEALSGLTSLPFPRPERLGKGEVWRVAVKVIDPWGNEGMRVAEIR